jgi:CubicO group peptidase (beta-lactamase class C family)
MMAGVTTTIRACLVFLVAAGACSKPLPHHVPVPVPVPVVPTPVPEQLREDTARRTTFGATFMAPRGWSIVTRGPAQVLETPEGDSQIALVDVRAKDADAAVAAAWAAYRPDARRPVRSVTPEADKDGWQDQRTYRYRTSPNERRTVLAGAKRHRDVWTVWIYDMLEATGEKRLGQVALILSRLLPPGYQRETFAGRRANPLDRARLGELVAFIERGREQLGIPGVALGLVQDGKVVFEGGFGPRELGKKPPVDARTLFIIASNTKPLTTLLLGTLVADGKLAWDTPVTQVFPAFRLGDAETTSRLLVKHLVCACTGLPRQDSEWLLEFGSQSAAGALALLGTMRPTSKFGEMYQYSNLLAAAGGYLAGHVYHPRLELGAAYDQAMRARVFKPLGMSSTTFDFQRARAGNHAAPHALTIDGDPALAIAQVNHSIVPVRPAGGAWSSVHDVLKYVALELREGVLPDGKRFISDSVLLERRVPQVSVGADLTYGMGLRVDRTYGVPVVRHGGSLTGFKSDMFWLPEQGMGATILTNSDAGQALLGPFRRKLLEVLFDGRPEADNQLAVAVKAMRQRIATERKLLTVPPDGLAGKLAPRYRSAALGDIQLSQAPDGVTFDFGEWKTPVASRKNPDGTVSLVTIVPGMIGLEFVMGEAAGKRTLLFRDAQHQYVFTET